jgi:hypothetical protein
MDKSRKEDDHAAHLTMRYHHPLQQVSICNKNKEGLGKSLHIFLRGKSTTNLREGESMDSSLTPATADILSGANAPPKLTFNKSIDPEYSHDVCKHIRKDINASQLVSQRKECYI